MHKNPYKSPLGRVQSRKMDKDKIKKSGWHEDGILVVKADDDRLSWPEQEFVRQIGNKLYGTKNKEVKHDG